MLWGRARGRGRGRALLWGGGQVSASAAAPEAPDPLNLFDEDLAFTWRGRPANVDLNGDALVAGAHDLSVHERHGVQAASAAQPAWLLDQLNGHPCMNVLSTNDFLAWDPWAQTASWGVFMVMKCVALGGFRRVLETSTDLVPGVFAGAPGIRDGGTMRATWGSAVTEWSLVQFAVQDLGGGNRNARIKVGSAAAVESGPYAGVAALGNWVSLFTSHTEDPSMHLIDATVVERFPTDDDHAGMLEYANAEYEI